MVCMYLVIGKNSFSENDSYWKLFKTVFILCFVCNYYTFSISIYLSRLFCFHAGRIKAFFDTSCATITIMTCHDNLISENWTCTVSHWTGEDIISLHSLPVGRFQNAKGNNSLNFTVTSITLKRRSLVLIRDYEQKAKIQFFILIKKPDFYF